MRLRPFQKNIPFVALAKTTSFRIFQRSGVRVVTWGGRGWAGEGGGGDEVGPVGRFHLGRPS